MRGAANSRAAMNKGKAPAQQDPGSPVRALRREPLPGQRPKPAEDDPQAGARVQAILQGPAYRLADEDVDLLARDEQRGVRLQLEYAKAQRQLEQHGVEHTIVIFGSTRIAEPAAALRALRLLEAQSAAAAEPDAVTDANAAGRRRREV